MVPVRRARSLQAQRERALQAAVEVVAEYGYSSAFAARVTSHAGISRLTFHQLFDSGEDCFLAAFDHGVERIAAQVTPAYLAAGSWRARVRAGLSALLAFLDREPDLGSLVIVDALTVGPRVLERRTQVLDTLIAAVNEGGDQTTSPLTAEGVVGAVFSVIHTCLSEQYSGPLIELLNPLMAMIVLPYLGHAAANRELKRPPPKTRSPSPQPAPAFPESESRPRASATAGR